ncbi:MAG: cell division protein ZipA [Pseudomonadota bacterium]
MEFGIREGLMLLGLAVMIMICVDGYRRVRDHRRSQLGIRLDDDQEQYIAPQPKQQAAPARRKIRHVVVDEPSNLSSEEISDSIRLSMAEKMSGATTAPKKTMRNWLSARRSSKVAQEAAKQQVAEHHYQEPILTQKVEAVAYGNLTSKNTNKNSNNVNARETFGSSVQTANVSTNLRRSGVADDVSAPRVANNAQVASNKAEVSAKRPPRRERGEDKPILSAKVEEVIIVNVIAKNRQPFRGNQLLQACLSLGLRFGPMNIFHRFERPEEKRGLLFSMANLLEPGTFDVDNIESFETPGICLFLSLPGPKRALYAFDLMLDTAQRLAHNIDGILCDEKQRPLTDEIIENYRQRVLQQEKKQRIMGQPMMKV